MNSTAVALLSVYLAGSSIKAVGQKFQLSDGSDLRGHLNHPDQLFAVQTPQVQQVGAATSSKALTITANTSQVYQHHIRFVWSSVIQFDFFYVSQSHEELHRRATYSGCDVRGSPCDCKGLVGDFGSAVWDRELVFAEQGVTLPSKDGVITETAEDGVTERQEKHLQHKHTVTTMRR